MVAVSLVLIGVLDKVLRVGELDAYHLQGSDRNADQERAKEE
jgi:hypothetical protein